MRTFLELQLVEFAEGIEHVPLAPVVEAGGIAKVEHRIFARPKLHALMFRGQKPAAPQSRHQRLAAFVLGDHHDKRREVGVLAAQAVIQPGPHAGPAGKLRTRLHERHARAVVDRFRVHRLDEANLVGHLRRMRQQFAEPGPALAMLFEPERRTDQRQAGLIAAHPGQPLPFADFLRQLLPVHFVEQRFVIVQIHLRRRAGLKQKDDPLGFRQMMQPI